MQSEKRERIVNNLVQRFLLVNVLTILLAQAVLARPIKVKINGEHGADKEVAQSVGARLQGTERYAVTDGDAELYLDLDCMEGKDSGAGGYICSILFEYYPEKLAPMKYTLSPNVLLSGRDTSSMAEVVFTSFVAATTNERLERAHKQLRLGVIGYCHSNVFDKNVRADCGQNLDKQGQSKQ